MILICRRHWDMILEVFLTLIVYVAWWYMSKLMIYNSRDWYMRWSTFWNYYNYYNNYNNNYDYNNVNNNESIIIIIIIVMIIIWQ